MAEFGVRMPQVRRAGVWACLVACVAAVSLWAADGPLTPWATLRGRTDANGYVLAASGTATGSDGPLTPMAQLRTRTDANGYLRVALSGASGVSSLTLASTGALGWSSTTDASLTPDVTLYRDGGANTLGVRSGTNAQILNVYNTYANAGTDYERIGVGWVSNVAYFLVQKGGTGSSRVAWFGTDTGNTQTAGVMTGGTGRWKADSSGHWLAQTDNTYDMGATGANRPRALFLGQASVTAGADATVVDSGSVRDVVYKATVTGATCVNANGFIKAALTADCTILTLPAKAKILDVYADVTAGFTCSGTCTGTKTIGAGISAGGVEILAAGFNVATTGQAGDADAELGSALTRAAAIQGGYLPSWSGTTAVSVRFTSGTGNWGDGAVTFVNAGSVTFYVTTRVMP